MRKRMLAAKIARKRTRAARQPEVIQAGTPLAEPQCESQAETAEQTGIKRTPEHG